MNKKHLWLRLLLSGGLFLFLFYTIHPEDVIELLAQSNPTYLLIAFLIAIGDRLIMACKWNLLLRAKALYLPWKNAIGAYWISTFWGLFLPATVGGDALRAYAVSKDGYRTADVISSIVVERILGFLALFLFVLCSVLLSISVFGQNFLPGIWNLLWIFAALLLFSLVAIYVSLNPLILHWVQAGLARWRRDWENHKIVGKLNEIYLSYLSYQGKKGMLMLFVLLSLVENLFPLFWTYFLALAFQIQVPLLYFFILVPIVLVLVRLPISIDGVGLQEGAFVYFLALIGVAYSEALLLGVASHILAILSVLPGGVLYSLNGLSFRSNIYTRSVEKV
jgi:uncharacterized protein (TIRG00374 family)